MSGYYIGVDLGTTSTKAIVFDKNGKMVSKSSVEYPINSLKPSFREQSPEEIFHAVIKTIGESVKKAGISQEEIRFVSFSVMMHSLIAVDEEGNPITNCIIWADNRSIDYADKYKQDGRGLQIYKRTGTPPHPMSPLYKLMWFRDKSEEIFKRAHKFISIKELVFFRLFGEYVVDYSIASSTGMFNIFELNWDREALKDIGIGESKLSKPVATTYTLKGLKREYSTQMGIGEDTPFVIGASDGCLANLGSNAMKTGTAAATIGTSGAVRVAFDKPVTDEKGRVFCYVLTEDKYIVGGAINNGGIVYRWFRDNFAELEVQKSKELGTDSYALLNEYIDSTEAGSNGLLFLPFLSGERAPYWNANLRGGFLGISDRHNKKHFTRAIIEGICYDMNDVFEAIRELVGDVEVVYANGGFTRSEEWVRILSDVMDTKIVIHENYESPCLGAIMLGMLATGEVKELEECSYRFEEGKEYQVREENKGVYKALFNTYKEAVNRLTGVLETLAGFQNK
jgi:gluconokinase